VKKLKKTVNPKFPIYFSGTTADYKIEKEGKKYRVWFCYDPYDSERFVSEWYMGIILKNLTEVNNTVKTISEGIAAEMAIKKRK